MPESALPPVYVRKEHKRTKLEPGAVGKSGSSTLLILILLSERNLCQYEILRYMQVK